MKNPILNLLCFFLRRGQKNSDNFRPEVSKINFQFLVISILVGSFFIFLNDLSWGMGKKPVDNQKIIFPEIKPEEALHASIVASKDTVTTGDVLEFSLLVTRKSDTEILSISSDSVIANQDLDKLIPASNSTKNDKIIKEKYIFQIVNTYISSWTFPSLKINFRKHSGENGTFSTDPILFHTKSLLPPDSTKWELKDLRSPWKMHDLFAVYLMISITLIIVAAVIIYIYWRKKRDEKIRKEKEKGHPPLPPDIWALSELEKLFGENLIEKGLIKEFYIRISEIIRSYFYGRFQLNAMDRTSEEILEEFRKLKSGSTHYELIESFLIDSDMVKFAKYIPSGTEIENHSTQARDIIYRTRIIKEPVGEPVSV